MEQTTYLLFIKRLDDLPTLEENKAARLGEPLARTIFPAGRDGKGRPFADYRWSRFKNLISDGWLTPGAQRPRCVTLGGRRGR